jgi:hypothetical protein
MQLSFLKNDWALTNSGMSFSGTQADTIFITRYNPGCLDGFFEYPDVMPEMRNGDIILYITDSVVERILHCFNLSHSVFDAMLT